MNKITYTRTALNSVITQQVVVSLRNTPHESSSQLLRGGSLTRREIYFAPFRHTSVPVQHFTDLT